MPSDNNKTTQKNNTVNNGDLVGRDKIEQHRYYGSAGALQQICENLEDSVPVDEQSQKTVDKLNHYLRDDEIGGVQGLKNKLEAGGRADVFDEAVRCKESFTKMLHRNGLSLSAQRVYVHALTNIDRSFKWQVAPKIKAGLERHVVDAEVWSKVLEPVYQELGPSALDVTSDEVEGMLYYLTGNCLIRWD